jgi:dTDP-4-amino-4,6-dideoxygalactose transaminase
MKIPFFRYPHIYNQQKDALLKTITSVMERGAFILQAELSEFEKNISDFVDTKYAIGVANGTDSLNLALLSAEI